MTIQSSGQILIRLFRGKTIAELVKTADGSKNIFI